MMNDVVELHGIAARVGIIHTPRNGRPIRLARAAFGGERYRSVPMLFSHEPGWQIAVATIWPNSLGHLCFRSYVPRNNETEGFIRAVENGELTGISACHGAQRQSSYVIENGEQVELIERDQVTEISLTDSPSCPGTAVWLADAAEDELRPDVATTRRYWSSDTAMQAAERRNVVAFPQRPHGNHGSHTGRGSTAVPPSVVALLSSREFHEGAMMSRRAAAAMTGSRFGRAMAGRIMCSTLTRKESSVETLKPCF